MSMNTWFVVFLYYARNRSLHRDIRTDGQTEVLILYIVVLTRKVFNG
jgi:hypothetical protein